MYQEYEQNIKYQYLILILSGGVPFTYMYLDKFFSIIKINRIEEHVFRSNKILYVICYWLYTNFFKRFKFSKKSNEQYSKAKKSNSFEKENHMYESKNWQARGREVIVRLTWSHQRVEFINNGQLTWMERATHICLSSNSHYCLYIFIHQVPLWFVSLCLSYIHYSICILIAYICYKIHLTLNI